MKITALTSFCVDVFPEQGKTYVGGNSLNFATHCKLSGVSDVHVIGGVGRDHGGKLIREHLSKIAVDHGQLYELEEPTASNKIFINKHIQMSNDNPCDGDADCKYPKNYNKA